MILIYVVFSLDLSEGVDLVFGIEMDFSRNFFFNI